MESLRKRGSCPHPCPLSQSGRGVLPSPLSPLAEGEGCLPSPPSPLAEGEGCCPHRRLLSQRARGVALTAVPSPTRARGVCPHCRLLSQRARGVALTAVSSRRGRGVLPSLPSPLPPRGRGELPSPPSPLAEGEGCCPHRRLLSQRARGVALTAVSSRRGRGGGTHFQGVHPLSHAVGEGAGG